MISRAPVVAMVLGLGVLLGTAVAVAAKSGIVARLDAPVPIHAQAGSVLTIGWTLTVPGSSGLIGTDTILRLYPANGGAPSDWGATQDRGNHYIATVTVPAGGIATIGIGIPGASCIQNVCVPAVAFFTIVDSSGAPVLRPGIQPPATSMSPAAPPTAGDSSIALIGAVLLGSLALASALWRWRRAE